MTRNTIQTLLHRHPILSLATAAVLLAAASILILGLRGSDDIEVSPRRGPIVEAVYGIGTVTSRSQFRARVGIQNTLRGVHVREGDFVKKGTLLLEFAEGNSVYAPFAGTVTSLLYYTGENVSPEAPILALQDLKDLYVLAGLEQQGALRVQRGFPVQLNFESIREQKFLGKVRSIFPQNSQFLVDIEVPNFPSQILPGMTADVAIQVANRENCLLVPVKAISSGKIVVRRNGHQEKLEITVGSSDSEWAEVTSNNIELTDRIVMKRR